VAGRTVTLWRKQGNSKVSPNRDSVIGLSGVDFQLRWTEWVA
jgi:hypothetical protein